MSDLIDRQAAIMDAESWVAVDEYEKHLQKNVVKWLKEFPPAEQKIKTLPSAQPEIIRCKDCIYYDPEHVENNGIRYEYKDMPKEAFDELGTGLVNIGYGINIGGRCCRDYNVGYSEDKRVFVSETNYCGRAERRTDETN